MSDPSCVRSPFNCRRRLRDTGVVVTVCTRHSVCNDDGTNVGGRRNEDERGRGGDGRDIACSDREKMDVKT